MNYNWNQINIQTITNLYLYGTIDTPVNYEDRLRLGEYGGVSIDIDMAGFMSTGTGRYANVTFTPKSRLLK